jgi:hypothetical protein
MHDKLTVGRIDEAMRVLKAPDVSSDRLHHSLGKYACPVPHEKLAFAGFLSAWPMYDEGIGHRDKKLAIVGAIRRAAPHAERVAAAIAAEVAEWREADTTRISRLNDTWQAGFIGLEQDDYDAVSEQFGMVTAFFANRSNQFAFAQANAAVKRLRRFWEPRRFIPGGLLALCAELGLADDTMIGLVVDARPSVLRSLEALFHCRFTWPAELVRSIEARSAAERILLEHPPFGSINRLRIDSDGRPASEVSVDIVLCNRDAMAARSGTGLTFGFGRHGCPAGDPVTNLLAAVWCATVNGWPVAPLSYDYRTVPGRHGTTRIEWQRFAL